MGNATATVKHPSMEGWKLLLVMALQADGRTIEGDPILVVDSVGAGQGRDGGDYQRRHRRPRIDRRQHVAGPLVGIGDSRRMSPSTIDIELVVREVLAQLRAAPATLRRKHCDTERPATAVAGQLSVPSEPQSRGVGNPVESANPAMQPLHAHRRRSRGHDERRRRPAGFRFAGWWFRARRSSRRRFATNCCGAESPWSMRSRPTALPATIRSEPDDLRAPISIRRR